MNGLKVLVTYLQRENFMPYPKNYDLDIVSYKNYLIEFYFNNELHYAEYTIDWDEDVAIVRLLNMFSETDIDLLDGFNEQAIEDIEILVGEMGSHDQWDQDRIASKSDYYYELYRDGIL